MFKNLLERRGYESLDQVRAEGEVMGLAKGRAAGLRAGCLAVIVAKLGQASPDVQARLETVEEVALLETLLRDLATADTRGVQAALARLLT